MKKQIIASLGISLAIIGGSFATAAINNANAEVSASKSGNFSMESLAFNESTTALATDSIKIASKYETVYAVTDHSGLIEQSYIGNTINTSSTALPLKLDIKYYLDGVEVSGNSLANKSGHVRINYSYSSTEVYQDKLVPFVVITGLTLDENKFSNLTIENGKVVFEDHGITVVGYSLVGLNENLGTDFLPNQFSFEADVKEFAIDTTYTLATDEIFADFDTTKLISVDSIISSVNQLSNGMNQIINGASQLNYGLGELLGGINTLKSKVDVVADKILAVTAEAEDTLNSFNEIVDTSRDIINLVPSSADFINEDLEAFAEKYHIPADLVAKLENIIDEKYSKAYSRFSNRVSKIDTAIANGTNIVSSFVYKVKSGTTELKDGVTALADGANQLYNGSAELQNGLITFKQQGIDRLVGFVNRDLNGFISNLKQSVEAAKSYHSYNNSSAESVKFIFKTPSIK